MLLWNSLSINIIDGLLIVGKSQMETMIFGISLSKYRVLWPIEILYIYNRDHTKYERETGDTSTINDLVTKQYEDLPYPEFSSLNMLNEERHYNVSTESDPSVIFPTDTLEKHNHYLHRGNQNFR